MTQPSPLARCMIDLLRGAMRAAAARAARSGSVTTAARWQLHPEYLNPLFVRTIGDLVNLATVVSHDGAQWDRRKGGTRE